MLVVAILILIGLLLLLAETVLPGLIAGSIGMLLLAIAVGYAYIELGLRTGNATLAVVFLTIVILTVLWIKFFPDSAVARLFVSTSVVGNVDAEKPELLDQAGVAFTDLRPAGTALINSKRVDVVTEGGFVSKGTPLRVIALEGMRVVVRPAAGSEPPTTAPTPPGASSQNQ